MRTSLPTTVAKPLLPTRLQYSPLEKVQVRKEQLYKEQDERRCFPSTTKQDKIDGLEELQRELTDSGSLICNDEELMQRCGFTRVVINELRRGLGYSRTARMLDSVYSQASSPEKVDYFVKEEALDFKKEFKQLFEEKVRLGDYVLVEALLRIFVSYKEFSDVFKTGGVVFEVLLRQLSDATPYTERRDNIILLLISYLDFSVIESSPDGFKLLLALLKAYDSKKGAFKPVVKKLYEEIPNLFCHVDVEKNTLLHLLATVGDLYPSLQFLLECVIFLKAIDSQNSNGNTVLHLLLLNKKMTLFRLEEYVQILVKYMTPEAIGALNNDGNTAIRLLLERGEDCHGSKRKIHALLWEHMTEEGRALTYEDGKTIPELIADRKKAAEEAKARRYETTTLEYFFGSLNPENSLWGQALGRRTIQDHYIPGFNSYGDQGGGSSGG